MTSILKDYLCSLADALRERTGSNTPCCAKDIPNIIRNLVTDPPYTAGVYVVSEKNDSDGVPSPTELRIFGKTYFKQCYGAAAIFGRYLHTIRLDTGITELAESFCEDADALKYVYIPNGITKIGEFAFRGCGALLNIIDADGKINTIPETVTTLEQYVFDGCKSLGTITMHDNITSIGIGVFRDTGVIITELPENLQTIGKDAFDSCTCAFTEMPASVTSINGYAFRDNPTLTEITFKGTPSSIASTSFTSCPNLTVINCPWAEGAVANAPWGATNATINYNHKT